MEIKLQQPRSLSELASLLDATLVGDTAAAAAVKITHLAVLDKATVGSVSFLSNPLYKKHLLSTQASAVILSPQDAKECKVPAIVSDNPRLALAKLLQLCHEQKPNVEGIHSSVVLGKNVVLAEEISIGPNCVIGDNCVLAEGVVLQAGVVVGSDCHLGAGTELKANVTVYNGVTIGAQCTIHSGTVVGSDGFGYALDPKAGWFKMLHLGGVVIGDGVEIGSNTSVDRGMLENTIIGNRVIIDNLVQIGHNVVIGDNTAIAGCVGIAGSTSIGKNCLIGGAACIAGHISITDNVHITATSAVNHSLTDAGVYSSGFPAKENGQWRRNVARFMSLDSMAKRIRELEKHFMVNV